MTSYARMLKLMTVGCFALLVGCAGAKVNPELHKKTSFAVVAYSGNTNLTIGTGLIGLAQNARDNSWGAPLIVDGYDDLMARLKRQPGVKFLDARKVGNAKSYAGLPLMGQKRTSPKGLRPLLADKTVDARLGALAKELKVDGVVCVNHWISIMEYEGQQYANDRMEVLIVGSDGKRLYEQLEAAHGSAPALNGESIASSLLGSASEAHAKEMGRNSILVANDLLVRKWFPAARKAR